MTLQELQRKHHERWVVVRLIAGLDKEIHLKDGRKVEVLSIDESQVHMSNDVLVLKLDNDAARFTSYDLGAFFDLVNWDAHPDVKISEAYS